MWEILDGSMLVIHQRIHTGERSYKCSSVGNYLIAAAHSLDIGQKGLMSTSKVGNFRGTTTDSLHTSQFMLLWHENSKYGNDFAYNSGLIKHCWVCAWEMSSESSECWSIFGQNSCPFGSKKFTPEKELMGAANEERLQPKAALIGTVKYCYVLMGFFLFIVLKYTCKKICHFKYFSVQSSTVQWISRTFFILRRWNCAHYSTMLIPLFLQPQQPQCFSLWIWAPMLPHIRGIIQILSFYK